MVLIYAGAYQGKLDFARKNFGIKEEDICYCNSDMESIDFGKKLSTVWKNLYMGMRRGAKR